MMMMDAVDPIAVRREIVLAIETSQRGGGVAVMDRHGLPQVEMLEQKKRHDDDLIPAIDRLFQRLGLDRAELGAVGVSVGPGGFTGLRIAVTTAKMMGLVSGAKLVAVPSALVAAEACVPVLLGEMGADEVRGPGANEWGDSGGSGRLGGPRIAVALAAKRGTFWLTRPVMEEDGPRPAWGIDPEDPARLAEADGFDVMGLDALIADEHLPEAARAKAERAGVPIVEPLFDPAACLRMTRHWLEMGRTTDALHLSPLYPREAEAVTLWKQRSKSD